jgi:SMI1-KNR4 cell-wall
MTIENLIRAMPPPLIPFGTFRGPWRPVEEELGTFLPQDYKDYVRIYGRGYLFQYLGVSVPRSLNPNVRLERNVRMFGPGFAQFEDPPYPIWPRPGGLLPFGSTDNGENLYWLTQGPPETWRIAVWDGDIDSCEVFNCDMTDFLAGLATGEILPMQFPDDLLPCDRLFKPDSAERDVRDEDLPD